MRYYFLFDVCVVVDIVKTFESTTTHISFIIYLFRTKVGSFLKFIVEQNTFDFREIRIIIIKLRVT